IAENIAEHYNEIIRGIRNVRAEMNVPKNRKATAYVVCEDAQLCTGLEMLRQAARNMAAVNDLIIQHDTVGIPEDAVSIVVPDATVYLPLEELIDFDQELERLTKEETRLAKEIARAEGMLSNEKFVSKAPEAKVQEEREKLETYRQMMEQVQERLESLKAKRS
ncbi:MAG TPA: valine--tRNA ligase, partial [Candidatus Dorea merdavium]|nr:valine--tRNA ligase [Candidatus Dorea merdavium]